MKNRFFAAVLAVFILCGCGMEADLTGAEAAAEEAEATVSQSADEEKSSVPVSGGTLKIAMRMPKTLNPLVNEDYTVDNALKLVFEPLFTMDSQQRVIPNIAESWSVSPDGLRLNIKVKSGLNWHDGHGITAEDVVFSLDTIKSASEMSVYKNVLQNVSGYSVEGNYVVITYSKPYSYRLYNLCFPVIPAHYYRNKTSADSDVSFKPVGSGSFKFLSYQVMREMILEKCRGINGQPYIDRVSVLITDSRETDMYAFEQSVIDVISAEFTEWGRYSASRKVISAEYNTNNFEFIGCNFKNPVLGNINVRQAVAKAIPADEIIDGVYLGHGVKSTVPVNPNSWLGNYDEQVKYDYSLEDAKKLIDTTGISKEQFVLSILVNSENKERCEAAAIIADRLNQIGMSVTVNRQPFDMYLKLLAEDSFDMFIGGFKLSKCPDLKTMFSKDYISSGINYFNYDNPQMEMLLNNAEAAVGDDNFKTAMGELQKFIARELPCIGICFKYSGVITGSSVKGDKTPVINNIYNNVQKWYID